MAIQSIKEVLESVDKEEFKVSGIEKLVCYDISIRQQHGIRKYGKTVDGNPLTRKEWLQHAYEEALDLAIYLKKLICNEEREYTDEEAYILYRELDKSTEDFISFDIFKESEDCDNFKQILKMAVEISGRPVKK